MLSLRRSKTLSVGSPAPSFRLTDQHGREHGFSDYRGKPVVLFFYPKDDTPGWTIEARGFRDAYSQFEDSGVVLLGCSLDSVESHAKWAEKLELPYPLLADPDALLAQAFGVHRGLGPLLQSARRTTFIIGPDGKVAQVIEDVTPRGHADEVMAALRKLGLV